MRSAFLGGLAYRPCVPIPSQSPFSLTFLVAAKRNFANSAKWFSIDQEAGPNSRLDGVRNVGIIAHIDAGKTTTTERMLYYSGHTKRLGNVDEGSTVTDFLPLERARGITIQSAAITFHWPPKEESRDPAYTINLIDTPGHADFTFEVLRSLRVLDGAVCILDGVAGVEAQTEKVWHQARSYGIPGIFFVNKLDRDGAAFGKVVREIASRLQLWPAVCQIPWFQNDHGPLQGIVDVIHLRALKWLRGGDGTSISITSLQDLESESPALAAETRTARRALIDALGERDDLMVKAFIECNDDYMAISSDQITSSLRKCLLSHRSTFAPVFAGASLKNIGVQPLIDAVSAFLPSPDETPDPKFKAGLLSGGLRDLVKGIIPLVPQDHNSVAKNKTKNQSSIVNIKNLNACALAFKVVYDQHKGVLVYVRVYQGSLYRNTVLFNTNLQVSERANRVIRMCASEAIDIPSISTGEIGVITGLKHARTGDTLISYASANPKNGVPEPLDKFQLRPIDVPAPVFFTAIESHSQAEEKRTAELLDVLLREDPSLQLTTNEDSGQKLLGGMGELHLEIAGNRLIQDMNAKATMGSIEIGYRECPTTAGLSETIIFERRVAGTYGKAGCESTISIFDEIDDGHARGVLQEGNFVEAIIRTRAFEIGNNHDSLPGHLDPNEVRHALRNGAFAALARGPAFAYQVHNAKVKLVFDPSQHFFGNDTSLQALTSAARRATQAALKSSHGIEPFAVAEPIMNVVISVNSESLGAVLKDLSSSRNGQVLSYEDEEHPPGVSVTEKESDLHAVSRTRVYVPPDPFEVSSATGHNRKQASVSTSPRAITARVPLRAMVGYLPHLRSLTAGRGSFLMAIDRFQKMPSHTQKSVLREIRGL